MFNKNLNRFQRRSMQLFSASILLTAFFTLAGRDLYKRHTGTGPLAWTVAIAVVLPFLGTIFIVLRYLAQEKDEFIRSQVERALLHGALITVALSMLYTSLQNYCGFTDPPVMLSIDIFLIASMFSFRFQLNRINSAEEGAR